MVPEEILTDMQLEEHHHQMTVTEAVVIEQAETVIEITEEETGEITETTDGIAVAAVVTMTALHQEHHIP